VTAVLTDIEVFVFAVHEFDIPCEWLNGCSTAAAWSLRCGGCGDTRLVCAPHKQKVDARIAEAKRIIPYCNTCDYMYSVPLPFLPL